MIDKITIFLPHLLMALAIWRLIGRDDLDNDPALPRTRSLLAGRNRAKNDPANRTDGASRDA